MAKTRRTRGTLAVLAGATSCTALLLGWMNPPLEAMSLSAEDLARIADRAVREDLRVVPSGWREVRVVSAPSDAMLLAAGAETSPAHFKIDRWGRPTQTARWTRQLIDASDGPAIRIDLMLHEGRTSPSAQQWEGLGVLVRTLNATVAPDGSTLPVRLDSNLSARSVAPAQANPRPIENASRSG